MKHSIITLPQQMKYSSFVSGVIFSLLFLLSPFCGLAGSNPTQSGPFFDATDQFMKSYVKNGKVDYSGIRQNRSPLNKAWNAAKDVRVTVSNANEYQAYWINVYNLAVIKTIVEHPPVDSPLKIDGIFKSKKHAVGGKNVTLDQIENELLRKPFNDPLIHFVLVCGAKSCPPLINQAYRPETLKSQMKTQAKKAINSAYFCEVKPSEKKVYVSMIMKWYNSDFTQDGATEIQFLNKYRNNPIPKGYQVAFKEYNWDLNDQ
jgi:hypothetical protein